ncbi:hypothetical protein [uncultured Kordia sp.]|uniref:hypothetical protein n=1 Tax=uncultured Kordia sp. TaxID=507699 RepID=UPI00262B719C|nr:hypothetical protein [uncultured Kordia sp.]
MKKKNAKSLKLRKNSISNLENRQLKGGIQITFTCTSIIDDCPSAWICPTQLPWDCPLPF